MSAVLSDHSRDRVRIMRAHSLTYTRGDLLADFELETIREVYRRIVAPRVALGAVSPAEWQVIEDAVEAMRGAPRQDDIQERAA